MIKLIPIIYCGNTGIRVLEPNSYRHILVDILVELNKSVSANVIDLVPMNLDVLTMRLLCYDAQGLIKDHLYHRGIKYD